MKQLLPDKFYKASLHTHSTVSDGKLTPLEVKQYYKEQGYSILALTDHHVIADHSDLNDEDFLCLTGIELGLDDENYNPPETFNGKTYHFCMIAKRPDNLWIPYAKKPKWEQARPHYEKAEKGEHPRIYDLAAANAIVKEANERGFFVTYNHSLWSRQCWPEYSGLEGLWAVEIRNTHNMKLGYEERNDRVWTDLLWQGKHLCPVMVDDSHRRAMIGGSWTMIGARELSYEAVVEAMEKGDVYCSCGPQIHCIAWEGTTLYVHTSRAARITVQSQGRFAANVPGEERAEYVDRAEFDMTKWLTKSKGNKNAYFRVTVTDQQGNYAMSRPYWLEEVEGF